MRHMLDHLLGRSIGLVTTAALLAGPGLARPQCFEENLVPSVTGSARVAAVEGETLFLLGENLVRFVRNPATGRWEERQVLAAHFSNDHPPQIALDGGLLAAGAQDRVSLYRELSPGGDWAEAEVLTVGAGGSSSSARVALDGDTLVIGDPLDSSGGVLFTGAAHVFRADPLTGRFTPVQTIPWPGPGFVWATNFGRSVGLADEFLAVGACPGTNVGEVRLYRANPTTGQFEPHSTLLPSAPWQSCRFGEELVMHGEWLMVGQPLHVFRYDALGDRWEETDVVPLPDRGYDIGFGTSLAFDGQRVVVTEGEHWGVTYDLDRASGTLALSGVLIPPYPFWWSLLTDALPDHPSAAIDGATVVLANRAGGYAASVFGGTLCTALGIRYCAPLEPNSMGMHARLDASGSDAVAEDRVLLRLMFAAPEAPYLFVAAPRGAVPRPVVGGSGRLCVGSPTLRLGRPYVRRTSRAGYAVESLELDQPAYHSPATILPGETWCFQAWYSDGGAGSFSDALAITFR